MSNSALFLLVLIVAFGAALAVATLFERSRTRQNPANGRSEFAAFLGTGDRRVFPDTRAAGGVWQLTPAGDPSEPDPGDTPGAGDGPAQRLVEPDVAQVSETGALDPDLPLTPISDADAVAACRRASRGTSVTRDLRPA